ncbi:hypothetical protein EYZ11_004192 [Aspergillus tanneri]|uniref:Uncharacterized protein n=1 Tax=Aspergillus tanneri TaxID=1220188 RepID=A0A4S3JLI6_9EURO|nr:hypothetical protein EYZ11_004192 [Aspergillus tanneri]
MTSPELLSATQTKALQSSLEELALEFNPDGRFICLSASHWRHPRNWHRLRKIHDTSVDSLTMTWLSLPSTGVSTAGVS